MKQIFKNPIDFEEIALVFFGLTLVFLFFPIRFVFPTQTAYLTGQYSDFTSIQLYLADFWVIISFFALLVSKKPNIKNKGRQKITFLLLFWLILVYYFSKSGSYNLSSYVFARFILLLVAYETSSIIFNINKPKNLLIKLFLWLGVTQAMLGITQFLLQRSVGLFKLGEQVILPNMLGVAKIVSGGTAYIRAYGTFAHPNLLAAFLVTAILFNIYLLLDQNSKAGKTTYLISLLVLIFGLTVTFSRAGFLALTISLIFYFSFLIVHKKMTKWPVVIFSAVLFFSLASGLVFHKFLSTRATITDQASAERIFYFDTGIKMLKNNWLFGVGLGQSVLHMQQYSNVKLWPWQIQPIHNYFLLAATEMGIIGSFILLFIFVLHEAVLILKSKSKTIAGDYLPLTVFCILLSYFILMLLDHYFYTLPPTQYLLWIMLGLALSQIKKIRAD